MEIFIFFGPPGAGKGTQAKRFAAKHGFKHISTGELLRQEITAKTELGQEAEEFINEGRLAPDDLVIAIIEEQLKIKDIPGLVFDGFPRNLKQALALDKMLMADNQKVKAVIHLETNEPELIGRLLKRAQTEGRSDDTEATIANRFDIYHVQTQPILNYYRDQKKSVGVNGMGGVEEVETLIDKVYQGLK